jgi:hypothetical protein
VRFFQSDSGNTLAYNDNGEGYSDETEPMLLLDITGSMNFATSASDQTPRCQTIKEALGILVERMVRRIQLPAKGRRRTKEGSGPSHLAAGKLQILVI